MAVDLDLARQRLEAERERLIRLREGIASETSGDEPERAALQELSTVDQHPADVGTEMFEREKDVAIVQGFDIELGEIEEALGRVEDGTYGQCVTCHKPIGKDRLEAMPQARYCIDDQSRVERSSA